jgi:oligoendopeptidase F
MDLLPFGNLPPLKPRRFLPADLAVTNWASLEPLFDQLQSRLSGVRSVPELEQWILDWGELSSALDEESTRRYIAMTCRTDDKTAEESYLYFLEQIDPQVKPRQFALARAFVTHPTCAALPEERYAVLRRDLKVQVELFRPENVPLETEEAKLGQQYQKLSGSLTVQYDGQERTLVQMARYLEETDRSIRQRSWELVANRRLQEQQKFEEQFEALLSLRGQIATNAGFANYRDYAFRKLGRFDYTADDCLAFHDAVESEVVPALRKLQQRRREALKADPLRPWDLAVDPLSRPPLRPFQDANQMVERTERVFEQLDPELAGGFSQLRELRLLDLENRKGKGPGGYQMTLAEARLPFIFMNAVGVQRDVETILHEAGHAFHALATQAEDIYSYRNPPIEICEVASMTMELLGNEFLEEFYSAADAGRARRNHLEGILTILAWIATVDAFQHWIYTHPQHSHKQRHAAWVALMNRFSGDVDWSGYDAAHARRWHAQLHIFLYPFYYIEYAIAQLGALQVWANSRRNKPLALAAYKKALALGGSRPLPELFAAANCSFAFNRQTLKPIIRLINEELGVLSGA